MAMAQARSIQTSLSLTPPSLVQAYAVSVVLVIRRNGLPLALIGFLQGPLPPRGLGEFCAAGWGASFTLAVWASRLKS